MLRRFRVVVHRKTLLDLLGSFGGIYTMVIRVSLRETHSTHRGGGMFPNVVTVLCSGGGDHPGTLLDNEEAHQHDVFQRAPQGISGRAGK